MIKFFKKLKWLVQHQEEIEKLLTKKETKKASKNYSLLGVPKNQMEYVNKLLSKEDN